MFRNTKNKKKKELAIHSSAAEYLTFVASTGESDASFEMRYEDENIWLTQKMMAALYDVDVRTINEHIKKIYSDGELTEPATIRKTRIVQTEGTYGTYHMGKYPDGKIHCQIRTTLNRKSLCRILPPEYMVKFVNSH